MDKLEIILPEELCNYMQRLHIELSGFNDNLLTIMRDGEYKYQTEHYERYLKLSRDTKAEYELAMEEIRQTFVPKDYRVGNFQMQIIFGDNLLIISPMHQHSNDSTCKGSCCV